MPAWCLVTFVISQCSHLLLSCTLSQDHALPNLSETDHGTRPIILSLDSVYARNSSATTSHKTLRAWRLFVVVTQRLLTWNLTDSKIPTAPGNLGRSCSGWDFRLFARWRHLTTSTRMLWGKLLYSVFLLLWRIARAWHKSALQNRSEVHFGTCSIKWRHHANVLLCLTV